MGMFGNSRVTIGVIAVVCHAEPSHSCSWRVTKQEIPIRFAGNIVWLVALTILKNISQWEGLSHILWKIKNVWNHQPGCGLLKAPNKSPRGLACWIHRDTTLCFFASGNMKPWKLSKEKEKVMSTVGILGFINPCLCSLGPSHFSSRLWLFVEKPTKLIYPGFMNLGLTLLNSCNHWLSDLRSLDLPRKHGCFTNLILNPWCEGLPSNGIG